MSDSHPALERHIEFGLRIGADSLGALAHALSHLATEISLGNTPCGVSGGSDSGYWVRTAFRTNEDVTHDSFFAEVAAWIQAEQRGEVPAAAMTDDEIKTHALRLGETLILWSRPFRDGKDLTADQNAAIQDVARLLNQIFVRPWQYIHGRKNEQ